MAPLTTGANQFWGRQRAIGAVGFSASDKEVTTNDYLYFTKGFENLYLVGVPGNIGRILVPIARNVSGVTRARVTVIPISGSGAYGSDFASEPATTWVINDLPAPPLFHYVKVEIGQRVGVNAQNVSAPLHTCGSSG
jgi:hypothetical protein